MSNIKQQIKEHLSQMAPHIIRRESAQLLVLALEEIEILQSNLNIIVGHIEEIKDTNKKIRASVEELNLVSAPKTVQHGDTVVYLLAEDDMSEIDNKRKSPWPDYEGNELFEGDTIRHPDGDMGVIVYLDSIKGEHNKWRVNYTDGHQAKLFLQIDDKGMAVKTKESS